MANKAFSLLHKLPRSINGGEAFKATVRGQQPEIWSRAFAIARGLGFALLASLMLNVVLVGLSIALAFRPADVIFVDKLGVATFLPLVARADDDPREIEAEAFAKQWVRDFMSLDAITAREDLARALSVADSEIQSKLKAQLIDSGVIDKIRNAFVHSSVRFETTKVTAVAADRFQITVTGERMLTAMGVERKAVAEPFKLELVLSRTSRTRQTPNGLLVRYVSGSFGSNMPVGGQQ